MEWIFYVSYLFCRRDGWIESAKGRIDKQANFSCNISCETCNRNAARSGHASCPRFILPIRRPSHINGRRICCFPTPHDRSYSIYVWRRRDHAEIALGNSLTPRGGSFL
jgi:hypothetical protein